VHYTVVAGSPVRRPAGRTVRFAGRRYVVLRAAGATVVSWRQAGHTCVLASTTVASRDLVRFASWG
jgi:hypothetical protein